MSNLEKALPNWKYPKKNEFPDNDRIVLNQSGYRCFYNSIEKQWYIQQFYAVGTRITEDVIAWCELPIFDEV